MCLPSVTQKFRDIAGATEAAAATAGAASVAPAPQSPPPAVDAAVLGGGVQTSGTSTCAGGAAPPPASAAVVEAGELAGAPAVVSDALGHWCTAKRATAETILAIVLLKTWIFAEGEGKEGTHESGMRGVR